jgi:hypothetical protein
LIWLWGFVIAAITLVIVMPAQLLFVGHQVVDRLVARFADLDPLVHLLARVPLLEPLVAVQGPGDEVVEVVGFLAPAELTEHSAASDVQTP